jgi:hypothetical protein
MVLDDIWDMICNTTNPCLVIGAFKIQEKSEVTNTTANNSHDVLAALQLMTML